MKFSIHKSHLAAALLAAGKADVRYYLNGVYVEVLPSEIRCTGQNGTYGATIRTVNPNEQQAAFIVPRATVEQLIKMKSAVLEFAVSGVKQWCVNGQIIFTELDGQFPRYRRVMPTESMHGTCRGFDPEAFAVFGKIAKVLGHKSQDVTTHMRANYAAAITIEGFPNFAGVIMPLNFVKSMGDNGMGIQSWAAL